MFFNVYTHTPNISPFWTYILSFRDTRCSWAPAIYTRYVYTNCIKHVYDLGIVYIHLNTIKHIKISDKMCVYVLV